MAYYPLFQYQSYVEPLAPIVPSDEAAFHDPWSEPVRFKIDPRVQVALAASGLFSPVMFNLLTSGNPAVNVAMRLQAWSEPVRFKPGLSIALQLAYVQGSPVVKTPATFLDGWYSILAEPVRLKPGLATNLQQFLSDPVRLLPASNVTAIISALETNSDAASGAINVIQSSSGGTQLPTASISVVEI